MNCLCQRVYDSGFTGVPRIDARLRHQYEVYGEDCIRRAYDHTNKHIPYSDTPRSPYCFVTKEKGVCNHESCDYARYRAPDTVRKMRYYIEHEACKAAVHYPDFLDTESNGGVPVSSGGVSFKTGGEETKYGTPDFLRRKKILGFISSDGVAHAEGLTALQRDYEPPNEEAVAEREAWEDAMFRLHKRIVGRNPQRNPKGNLPAQSIESFREYVAEAMYGVASMETGQDDVEAYIDAERKSNERYERFWNGEYGDWTDEELQAAYSST